MKSAALFMTEEVVASPAADPPSREGGDAASLMGRDMASLTDMADLSPLLNPLHRSSTGPGDENRPEVTHASWPYSSSPRTLRHDIRAHSGHFHPFGRGRVRRGRRVRRPCGCPPPRSPGGSGGA